MDAATEVEEVNSRHRELRNYVPLPFWAMDSSEWLKYTDGLADSDKGLLSQFPFRWAYVRPNDAASALQFLKEIGVATDDLSEDDIRETRSGMPTFDELVAKGSISWSRGVCSDMPGYRFRMTPEWERMAGVILNWPVFYPPLWSVYKEMISGLDHVTTFLRIPEGYLGAAVLTWLRGQRIDEGRVRAIPGPVGDIWPRDYSPLYGVDTHSGEAVAHKFTFAAYYEEYRQKYRYIVDIDDSFAWVEGYKLVRSEVMMDGGSVVTDGNGTYIITRRVLDDNASVDGLEGKIKAWLGADRLVVVDEEPGDMLGHVCNFKIIGPAKAVVGIPDRTNTPLWNYLKGIEKTLSTLGYDVVSIPCGTELRHSAGWEHEDYPGAYANSLMVNDRILVPQYYWNGFEQLNIRAIDAYKDALPGREIVPVDCMVIGNGGGAVNCSSKELPVVKG